MFQTYCLFVNECYSQRGGYWGAAVGNAVIMKVSTVWRPQTRGRATRWNEGHSAKERQGSQDRNTMSCERGNPPLMTQVLYENVDVFMMRCRFFCKLQWWRFPLELHSRNRIPDCFRAYCLDTYRYMFFDATQMRRRRKAFT
jgi:hypothetical protein